MFCDAKWEPAMHRPHAPEHVLDLWFPDDGHWTSPERHADFWQTRMHGGMDEVICRDFAGLTRAAAAGELDLWAATPRGRLALLIALDQFPRSLWRGTPAAYAQDIKAALLAVDGIRNGHFSQLRPWEQIFFVIALGHCEGPDHLERLDLIDRVTEEIVARMPPELAGMADRLRGQNAAVRAVIARFGRHPHRNPIYGRVSSAAEEAYIATGDFPHVRKESAPG
jgi:uncharacterized protein (DUF924 family)